MCVLVASNISKVIFTVEHDIVIGIRFYQKRIFILQKKREIDARISILGQKVRNRNNIN